MFKDLISNKKAKQFLENELKFERKAGTYLFYGEDRELLKKIAKIFAKSLNCSNILYDYCDECENCIRIEHETHGDLEILEDSTGVKIDKVRELSYKNSITSYEGKKKIYIIRDIEKMRREAGNALLKLIEEPNEGTFFILLSRTLNILPTIKSRSIILHIEMESFEELGVSQFEYDFFLGNSKDIEEYKRCETIDLNKENLYTSIGKNIKDWISSGELKDKVEVYKAIRDFINSKSYLSVVDKLFFAEEIIQNVNDRELIKELIRYTILTTEKNSKNLEKFLELKKMMRTPVNMKILLTIFYNYL